MNIQVKTELLKALSLKNHWNPNKLSKAQQQELTLRANILADKYAQKAQIIFLTTLSKRGSITNRQGTIKARNKLLIDSDNNIINQGGSFESGGDTVLIAKNDVSVYTNYYQTTGANGDNIYGAIGKQSKLSSGGKLSIQAGNNVNFVGANVSSQGDTSIEADNSFNISSIAIKNKRTSFENRSDEYVTTVEQSTKQHKTNLKSGGNFSVRTGGAVNIQGADISAEQAIDIDATQGINSIAVYDTYSKKVTIEEKSKGGLAGIASSIVGGTNTTTQATDKGNANSNQLTSKHATVTLKSEQDINLEATNIKAEQDIKITSIQGKVALLSARNWDSYSEETKGEGLLWKTDKGKGHSKQTFTANQFTTNKGTTDIDAKEAIKLDIEKQQVEYQVEEQYQTTETYTEPDCTFFCTKTRTVTKTRTITKQRDETDEEAINRLIKTDPGKAWMATLISNKNKNKLTTNQITSINKDWDYNNSGLTDAAQLALTIAVSSFTGGLGIYSNAAGSLAGQASVASINSLGRGEGLENSIKAGITAATSEDALKGAFTSIFTAGANNSLGITGEGFANNMYRTGVSTTINTGINGGDLADNLLKAYTTALIDIGAKKGANWIGDNGTALGGAGSFGKITTHSILGCVTASAKGGDCQSGALGAGFAESMSNTLDNNDLTNKQDELLLKLATIGVAAFTGNDVKDAMRAAINTDKNNRQEHISRDLNDPILKYVADHRANVIIRDSIEDYPEEIREKLGDPVYVEGKGYVYVLEDLSVPDANGIDRLHPSVNNSRPNGVISPTLNDYKNGTGHIQTYAELPDDFDKENALINNYIHDIENGVGRSPEYPNNIRTASCFFNHCPLGFYNSNTVADRRLERVGIPVPNTGFPNVPGGYGDMDFGTGTAAWFLWDINKTMFLNSIR